jgi:hypothetical protein
MPAVVRFAVVDIYGEVEGFKRGKCEWDRPGGNL